MKLYSIYDKVAETYSPVFAMQNDATAIRSWKHDCEKVPADALKDYELVALANWSPEVTDQYSTPLVSFSKPVHVFDGASIVEEEMMSLDFDKDKEIVSPDQKELF